MTEIVGSAVVRNEDVFVEQAIRNRVSSQKSGGDVCEVHDH